MPEFISVAKVADLPEGSSKAYRVQNRMVAVFHTENGLFAIDDTCPHMGASLADGHVEEQVVACPWHAWRFSICDGTWCDSPTINIDSFEVRVEGDNIQVRVPDEQRQTDDTPASSE
tara:strand:- start:391 stop:741 length:351 start_codon:yes stop_codon:yes gene_type:complete